MLVLSRRPGQAIVIDDQIIVTLDRFTRQTAEFSLKNVRGVPLGREVLHVEERLLLPRDVEMALVETGSSKVRLGLTCRDDPHSTGRITRLENRADLRGPI